MDLPRFAGASHTRMPTTNSPALTRLVAMLALLVAMGCPTANDDDSATPANDDDATAPPEPLADTLGVVNLTNVRQPAGTDYVDLAAAFGDFAAIDLALVSPTAYISTWGVEAALWRLDLGGWPLPLAGESEVLDLFEYVPWLPDEQLWWDAGDRVAAGAYLSLRYADDNVLGYQVDDPLSPGGSAWTPGGTMAVATSGGADIVAWTSAADIPLPGDMELIAPLPGSVVETPAAQQFTVTWNPKDDGATVTLVLLQGLGITYIANVPDTGEHVVPASVMHDELGPGEADLIVSRMVETVIAHPQGDIVVRSRSEERAEIVLLDDLVLSPAYGSAGQTVDVDLRWFTGSVDGETVVDFGDGITVDSVTPDGSDPQRATVQVSVDAQAALGTRTVSVSNGGESIEAPDAFTVMNLNPSDDCTSADAIGPLANEVFISSTDGLSNTLSSGYACHSWSLNGSDATYAVDLEAGVTVRIAATMPDPGDAALSLLSACGDAESAVACADDGFEGDTEEIIFTPETSGTYYIVVDGYFLNGFGAPSSPFELSVDELESASPVTPPWIVPGTASTLDVTGTWDAGIVAGDVTLGAGLTVTNAQAGASLSLQVTADGSAAAGPRVLDVDNGGAAYTFSPAVFVTDLPGTDTCTAADAWGDPGLPGLVTLQGYAAAGTNSLDDVGCFTWGSPGSEVVHALDLTEGDLVDVHVTSDLDPQIYVLSDCADPAASCINEASSDTGLLGEDEVVSDWLVPATGRYYLVVDLYEEPLTPYWGYTLQIAID